MSATVSHEAIDQLLESRASTIARDLRLNLKRILEEGALSPVEGTAALLACASAVGHPALASHAREQLAILGLAPEQIQEAAESAAIMGMLNTYYRFKHFVGPEKADDYKSAGLRMTALARPALGKELFEMLALAVSAINGCETCVKAHEKVLRDGGVSADKVHDLARMAAVIKGLQSLAAA